MIDEKHRGFIKYWLLTGVVMVLIQVLLGAITRLTGSGLSITRWDIVTGTLYPMSDDAWQEAFRLYKQTPQYGKINLGMELSQFKFIYFWEYFHRLWARLMGLVFIIPFAYWTFRNRLGKSLTSQLLVVVALAAFVASLGWIMVASGLVQRPWVNAYKLSFHLCAALLLISYLWWTTMKVMWPEAATGRRSLFISFIILLAVLMFIQIFLGGVMSGMKAGLVAPTWPDMKGSWWPDWSAVSSDNEMSIFSEYERDPANALLIQFLHRNVAYLLFVLVLACLVFLGKRLTSGSHKRFRGFFVLLCLQMLLGIMTLLHCVGSVPILWGSVHQMTGFVSFLYLLHMIYMEKYASLAAEEKK